MLKNTSNLRKTWKILSLSFILAFSSIEHLQAMEEEEKEVSDPKFFKSPSTISCSHPLMVSFHHEETLDIPQIGVYGEKIAKRLFLKYALFKERGVDCFKSGDPSCNGFDFFMVDSENKIVLLLEAKSQSMSDTPAKRGRGATAGIMEATASEKRKKDSIMLQKDESSLEEIKNAMKRRLENTQLSRIWCHQSLELRKNEDYSDSKRFEAARTFKDIVDMLEKESPQKFRFLRLCSMTYVNLTCSAMPTTTYYSMIRDGASDVPYRDDDLGLLERTTNGGLSRYFLHTSEMNIQDARDYIRNIYHVVYDLKYPVQWIEPYESASRGLLSSPMLKPLRTKRKKDDEKESTAKAHKIQENTTIGENSQQEEPPHNIFSPHDVTVSYSFSESSDLSKTNPLLTQTQTFSSEEVVLPSQQDSLHSPMPLTDPTLTKDEKEPVVRVYVRSVLKKYLGDKNLENCLAELEKKMKGRAASKEKNAALITSKILKNEKLLESDKDLIRELNDKVDIEDFLKKDQMAQISDISDWIKIVRALKKPGEVAQNPLNESL